MERRKILLGSGAALATVLAGCSSTETDEETPSDDDGFDDGGSDDGYEDDDDGDDGDDEHDDVPGVDNDSLEPDSDHFSIERIDNSPETLQIVVATDTTDSEILHKELEGYAEGIAHAIDDRDRFKTEIEVVELILEYDGSRVAAIAVNIEWLLEFLDGEITKEELGGKVVDAKE
ncbi:hypothetical protein D8Y22_09555 [Salinadaptatus halalkaliphilus]|uniref:DUF8159 domain-containing protein n=1 Tax=Salinadaptatus halalkaliphilus TaxID=2419781 RepID=A0A4S3TQ82_9EURY|nr:hypothetical protein [Salinadaptatus halalkaliphilus]THE65413.1 hypothetical protein D8Y22_09555 [Salinadaptatus halalkaliphilus]